MFIPPRVQMLHKSYVSLKDRDGHYRSAFSILVLIGAFSSHLRNS